jgi:hypothetical protein
MNEMLKLIVLANKQILFILTLLSLIEHKEESGLHTGLWVQLQNAVVQESRKSFWEFIVTGMDRLQFLYIEVTLSVQSHIE